MDYKNKERLKGIRKWAVLKYFFLLFWTRSVNKNKCTECHSSHVSYG